MFTSILHLPVLNLNLLYSLFILLISVLLLIFTAFLLKYMIYSNLKDNVGYVPTFIGPVADALIDIVNRYVGGETKSYSLVEPGAGMANVTNFLASKFEWKEAIAIEGELSVHLLSRVKQLFRKTKINFVCRDIYKYDYPKNSVIYCYLLNNMITKMYNMGKFKGSLIITLTFSIEGVEPTEKIAIKGFLQKHMYVYDFRNEK